MSVSLAYLERCSADTGFQVSVLEKVARLGEYAAEINRHTLLREVLVLKGGSALNLAFGEPTRLSVDLDFNYIGKADREEMLADRPPVEKAAADLARRNGYRIQQSADSFAGRKLFLHYRSVLGPEDRIEVDLNFLFRVPLVEPQLGELGQPGELDRPHVRLVGCEELLAGKFLAMLDRCAARDAWDIANLTSDMLRIVATPAFRARFVAIAGILDHPLSSYGRQRLVDRLDQRVVDEQLSPMLARGGTPDADELVERSWAIIGPLVKLTQ
ncbi:MAG: nucleotidyl transferase AbiEii/AbiGii toxin family protein, partial [Planctomycetota bacterium]